MLEKFYSLQPPSTSPEDEKKVEKKETSFARWFALLYGEDEAEIGTLCNPKVDCGGYTFAFIFVMYCLPT